MFPLNTDPSPHKMAFSRYMCLAPHGVAVFVVCLVPPSPRERYLRGKCLSRIPAVGVGAERTRAPGLRSQRVHHETWRTTIKELRMSSALLGEGRTATGRATAPPAAALARGATLPPHPDRAVNSSPHEQTAHLSPRPSSATSSPRRAARRKWHPRRSKGEDKVFKAAQRAYRAANRLVHSEGNHGALAVLYGRAQALGNIVGPANEQAVETFMDTVMTLAAAHTKLTKFKPKGGDLGLTPRLVRHSTSGKWRKVPNAENDSTLADLDALGRAFGTQLSSRDGGPRGSDALRRIVRLGARLEGGDKGGPTGIRGTVVTDAADREKKSVKALVGDLARLLKIVGGDIARIGAFVRTSGLPKNITKYLSCQRTQDNSFDGIIQALTLAAQDCHGWAGEKGTVKFASFWNETGSRLDVLGRLGMKQCVALHGGEAKSCTHPDRACRLGKRARESKSVSRRGSPRGALRASGGGTLSSAREAQLLARIAPAPASPRSRTNVPLPIGVGASPRSSNGGSTWSGSSRRSSGGSTWSGASRGSSSGGSTWIGSSSRRSGAPASSSARGSGSPRSPRARSNPKRPRAPRGTCASRSRLLDNQT
jgi:hypothetical protein